MIKKAAVCKNIITLFILITSISCSNITGEYKDDESSVTPGSMARGQEFILAFPENYQKNTIELVIHITSERETSGTVEISGIDFETGFTVTADSVTSIVIPTEAMSLASDTVENLGVVITAGQPVAVYCVNRQEYTTDGYRALPVDSLGTRYYIMSYTPANVTTGYSLFEVAATQDNTVVEITPACASGTRETGVTYSVLLNRGQTYQLKADNNCDITGSLVRSDKPVSVFGGSTLSLVPSGVSAGDHLVEQMVPVGSWGSEYYTTSYSADPFPFITRIIAGDDNTLVTVNGTGYQIQNGEFIEVAVTGGLEIQSDKPVMAAQFFQGGGSDGGDPSMIVLPPVSWYRTEYTFYTGHSIFTDNYISLVVRAEDIAGVMLDGSPVDSSLFSSINDNFYGGCIPVSAGIHTVTSAHGFGLIIFGEKDYESYAMSGG